ncbi:MAG TPA: family 43 glycosylhydrolase [Armatimonadota bacterium]|jgi:hypothetical protein
MRAVVVAALVGAAVVGAGALALPSGGRWPPRGAKDGAPSVPRAAAPAESFAWSNPLNFAYSEGQAAQRAELRDPCILQEGDAYYLTFTMWPFGGREERLLGAPNQGGSPGIALYTSKDLKSWSFVSWLVRGSDLPEDSPYKDRFWAPEIHKIGGRFYLVFTADNWIRKSYNPAKTWGTAGYAFIGVADRVIGPYTHITYVEGGPCDMSLFEDSDKQVYALKPKGDLFIQKIDLSRLDEGKVRFVGEERRVVAADNEDIGLPEAPEYLEGPWMEKVGKTYVLFYAAPYKDPKYPELLGYRTGAAYADKVMGPYKKDPRGSVFFGGHLTAFDGPDNRKWLSYRWEKDDTMRGLLCIDPFELDAHGQVQAKETLGPQRTKPYRKGQP